ncbi:gamma-glutamyl-gamma-aminobutyraldehyde dehydrogenase [Hahella sp. CCB-MM4]|uniref:aldehyde dehydrogenase n=1 Tax=Hahella sp. (strain CCB-MM4) TaxID=1926491 RepID=UPI000B9C394B|nr:aldehyde dehydrogenase [Hahella sp. CCB-MM4]OZG72827.1 gamma-glutamyl-gamma-aminobutyraldehyde dehydrogenase [Hahella sp. CCB-MM4]
MPSTKEDIFQQAKDSLLYAGALIPGTDRTEAQHFETLNPFDHSVIGKVQRCNGEHVDAAVKAGREVFESGAWAKLSPGERKSIMLRWSALMEQHKEELAALDCVDAGKPITECLNTDIPDTIQTFSWYAEAIDKQFGKVSPTANDKLALIVKEPIGVVGAVLPWNFPALMFAWKVAPALAAGNSVVVKPAELTSLSAYRMVQLAHEAGVPEGALTLVTGFGEEVGKALGLHPDVDVVSFTGSTEVGRLFLTYAAQSNLKEIILECGGKSPQVIFEDAYDLETIADDVLSAAFWNMGENCSCGSRLIVHESLKNDLLGILKQRLSDGWKVGNPQDPETSIGPMIEPAHFDKVCHYIDTAKKEGAELIQGGDVLALGAGMTIEPTIFDAVTSEMSLFREEVFGPVLAVSTFETEAEAIDLANATSYGLAASLYTSDVRRAHRASQAIKAGTVSVNCFSEGDITTPFGGYKTSGFGGRDNGLEAFDQYVQTKTIWYAN